MMTRSGILLAALALGTWSLAGLAAAEAYSYVDGKGQVHLVDSVDRIPEVYRDRVTDLEASAGEPTGGITDWLAHLRHSFAKGLTQSINQARRAQGGPPLSHAQKREIQGLLRQWMPILLLSHAGLAILLVVVVIHGLTQGHPLWAVANLLLMGLPLPLYCMLHIGDRNRPFKILFSAATLLPALALLKGSYDLTALVVRLAGHV